MNTQALRLARKLFNNDLIPQEHNRAYRRKWVRSLRLLGDRWLLAKTNRRSDHSQNKTVATATSPSQRKV